jgi:prevent-host-death family protein
MGMLHELAKSAILAKSADLAKCETAMKTYTLTDLGNKSGEIVEAAHDGPVDITSRGRRKYVLMTAERYDRLAGRNTQKAYSINTMTEAEVDELLAGLDALIEQAEQDDE